MPDKVLDPGILATVAAIDREIEELQRAKNKILGLGRQPIAVDSPSASSLNGASPIVGDALAAVREQEFAGMSIGKAAQAFLRKIGRHEKTPTIVAALAKGGVSIQSKNPVTAVYTTLWRRPAFVSLGKNYWDLAERRPDMVQDKKPKASPKRRGRRPRNKTVSSSGAETNA
jgi:hypothetical protein